MIYRTYHKITYADGRVEEFNPYWRWHFGQGMTEISTRHDWGIGIMWKWTIGTWSRYRTAYVQLGWFTIYAHYGRTDPHNPRTGEVYHY
jgi:hypothetical protein